MSFVTRVQWRYWWTGRLVTYSTSIYEMDYILLVAVAFQHLNSIFLESRTAFSQSTPPPASHDNQGSEKSIITMFTNDQSHGKHVDSESGPTPW